MTVTEQQRKRIKEISKEFFLDIIKHQDWTELEGNLNALGKFCVAAATTFVTTDWDNAVDELIKKY